MLASIFAAKKGCEVTLFEKNEKLGKKLYITGKGRCNVTNNCDPEELLNSVVTNAKFLYSAFYTFTSQDMMEFLEEAGTALKTERGNRVFPCSDHSSDVIRALERQMKKYGVRIHLKSQVERLLLEEGTAAGIILTDGSVHRAEAVIVATGGLSYPTTGSTGDGYRFAREAGHTVTDLSPSLVPLRTKEEYIPEMAGLSLKNVELTVKNGKKILYRDFGEMMFTHSGITGPLVLSASARLGTALRKSGELSAFLDLKPALTPEQLDARILRDFDEAKNKRFKNSLNRLFPAKLVPVMVARSGIDPEKKVNEVTAKERERLVEAAKSFHVTLTGLRGYNEAIITQGGVDVKEINPATMESKKAQGLYFAGEVLDLDGVTGGFNLQIAWSTGMLAGRSAGTHVRDRQIRMISE